MTASVISALGTINRPLTLAARVSGAAIALGGLAMALRFADDTLGDAGAFWNGLAILLGPVILGGLIILAGDATSERPLSTPRWQKFLGAVALVAVLALALKATDTRMIQSGGETGVWGLTHTMAHGLPMAILLFVASPGLTFTSRTRAFFGLAAGVVTIVAALLLGVHASSSRLPFPWFWLFLGSASSPATLGLLLITASLDRLPPSPAFIGWLKIQPSNRRQTLAFATSAAGLAIIAAVAYSIWLADNAPQDGFWFGLGNLAWRLSLPLLILAVARVIPSIAGIAAAIAIYLALAAHAIWLGSYADASIWWWLLIATSSGAYAVLAVFLCLGRRAESRS